MPDPEPVDAPLWLGIDLGTQGVRAVLVDGAGTLLGSGSAPLESDVRDGDRHEQDPAEWWRAIGTASRTAVAARLFEGRDRLCRRRLPAAAGTHVAFIQAA